MPYTKSVHCHFRGKGARSMEFTRSTRARLKFEPESSSRHKPSWSQDPTVIFRFFSSFLCLKVVIIVYIMVCK